MCAPLHRMPNCTLSRPIKQNKCSDEEEVAQRTIHASQHSMTCFDHPFHDKFSEKEKEGKGRENVR